MPIMPTYPGVYIEEVPSGVRTITGVATSITAFVGRALRGPVNEPITINSYGDFERTFGGLWKESTLGYAVRDFYLNGGSRAIIVRLFQAPQPPAAPAEGEEADPAAALGPKSALSLGSLTLEAAYEGTWGQHLRGEAEPVSPTVATAIAERMGLETADIFNLTVRDAAPGGATETFRNISLKDSPRRIDKVLAAESKLVRWQGELAADSLPAVPTAKVTDEVTAAEEALEEAEKALAAAKRNGTDVAAPQAAVDEAKDDMLEAKAARAATVTDGVELTANSYIGEGMEGNKQGLYALKKTDLFNILCIPPFAYQTYDNEVQPLVAAAAKFCEENRAFYLVNPPLEWRDKTSAIATLDAIGTKSNYAAVYFPMLEQPNPLRDNQMELFSPVGAVAGIFARTDAQRGVWKAPAGTDATLVGVPKLAVSLTDGENGELNPLGINCLRTLPAAGRVVWGARTLQGDDRLASEWKYVPVRRTALFIAESLYRGTQWAVFEPNDEPLWAQLRLNIGAFMQNLFRQGAFQGSTPQEAYLVKCDRETTTQNDINLGIVNVVVGFAPLKPAEFVIIKIQQLAGQIAT
ncbi:phage tail sheath subtilisin-like domain-containing protein [Pseudanabaena sp. FACHB-2040]|uniref:phage tail sheath subtilisin-like domain-containing protein n=1 Tax=Pseudanabaena sp. FACHB-2040 TaxID=2692859 RepID=UPI00168453F9|nr:phage tail sheath subtilisin-like domain-containing protein [Pseudanabaena sp. FACHB-2040]MBD2261419.1 phage tail sheath family protein [Pseudanabaena sp. FACHB-2040]